MGERDEELMFVLVLIQVVCLFMEMKGISVTKGAVVVLGIF